MVKGLVLDNYLIFQMLTNVYIYEAYFEYKILYYFGFPLTN